MAYGDYQDEIYMDGLRGVVPRFPMTYDELEPLAQAAMPSSVRSYVVGGAGDERTLRANVTAFERWGLVPRMMVGATDRDLSVDLFGMRLPSPLFMAPVGVIGLCAQDGHGDLATARAAARTGVPMIASTLTVDPLEQVVGEFGGTPGFFQLYTPTDRELAESLVHRAEKAAFKGIVVTWTPGSPAGARDLATSNFPQLCGNCLANYCAPCARPCRTTWLARWRSGSGGARGLRPARNYPTEVAPLWLPIAGDAMGDGGLFANLRRPGEHHDAAAATLFDQREA